MTTASSNHLVAKAQELAAVRPRLSLREISAELAKIGKLTANGLPFSASAVQAILES